MRRLVDMSEADRPCLRGIPAEGDQLERFAERKKPAHKAGDIAADAGRRRGQGAAIDTDA
jgi:hypothetical protein